MTRKSVPKVPESGVMRACLDLLAAEKVWHRRWNAGAVKTGNRFYRFGEAGDGDILALPILTVTGPAGLYISGKTKQTYQRERAFLYAHPLWIEAKSDTGKQTEEQKIFEQDVKQRGHSYLLVRDVDTLRDWLKAHGATR